MQIQLNHKGKTYTVDTSTGIDLSSRYGQKSKEPKAWQTADVQIKPFSTEDWTAEVKQGSSVNFFDIAFNPHGNGTHTESIGHIREDQLSVSEVLTEFHFMCRLVHMQSETIEDDQVLTLKAFLAKGVSLEVPALIINVDSFAPNHDFSNTNPPYFEPELLQHLANNGVKHFITNLPSVDREVDDGALAAHKAFWNFEGTHREENTITELAQVPPALAEGLYLLNLQTAPFYNDAAPSRLVVFELNH